MRNFPKFVQGRGTDALSRRIGGDQVRVFQLEIEEFTEQAIILPIGNLGMVLHIVLIVVVPDLVLEFGEPIFIGLTNLGGCRYVVEEGILLHCCTQNVSWWKRREDVLMVVTHYEYDEGFGPDLTVAQDRETVKGDRAALFDFRTSAYYSKRLFVP